MNRIPFIALFALIFGCAPSEKSGEYRFIYQTVSQNPCQPKTPYGTIHFDCTMQDDAAELIKQDLQFLRTMRFFGPAAKALRQMLRLQSSDGEALFEWLGERIHFILDESFEKQTGDVYATNFSSAVFRVSLQMKMRQFSLIDVPGFGMVEVNSQHVGVILLGPIFFDSNYPVVQQRGFLSSIERLTTLFHEARHGDGRGQTMAFPHVLCPEKGTSKKTCDPCSNGPKAVEALFQKSVLESCLDCSSLEIDKITERIVMAEAKILAGAPECDDRIER